MKINFASFPVTFFRWLPRWLASAAHRPLARASLIHLPPNQAVRFEKSSGVASLETKSGRLWLTGSPADGDVLLSPGQRFELKENWPYVIEALESSGVFVCGTFEL